MPIPFPQMLRFGVPTLDQLFGSPQLVTSECTPRDARPDRVGMAFPGRRRPYGIGVISNIRDPMGTDLWSVDTVSICLIGADGVGKSLLAMHLASRYRADVCREREGRPFVIYVSTDLSYSRARLSWGNFALDYPAHRIEDPFDYPELHRRLQRPVEKDEQVDLTEFVPLQDQLREHADHEVLFLDLATHTSGDDWAYLNRFTASLPQPGLQEPRHLIIVDAVEGLEVLVGDRDAFGHSRDRRSRVAQLLRTAAGKCHVVVLVEKQDAGKTPEEFICDTVISLSRSEESGYARRAIEVEKVRGQSHVRGSHEISIRSGRGSSTGTRFNADDPFVVHPASQGRQKFAQILRDANRFDKVESDSDGDLIPQGYAFVFHSLHFVHRQVMDDRQPIEIEKQPSRVSGFGMAHLDEILKHIPPEETFDEAEDKGDPAGLPVREPAALIGEDGTYKSKLSKAFLAQAHHPDRRVSGVATLLTTKTLDDEGLSERLNKHLPLDKPPGRPSGSHVLCRRLEIHHVTSPILFHIMKQLLRRAQLALLLRKHASDPAELEKALELLSPASSCDRELENGRRILGWQIRYVIDNWTAIGEIYPQVKADPLFWPCVLFFIRREGISALIVASEPIGFSHEFRLSKTFSLQDLTSIQLFTWRVPFFGESRVAITITPPLQSEGRGSVIRELRLLGHRGSGMQARVPRNNSQRIAINPSFELYDGLTTGKPRYVTLKVWLFQTPNQNKYAADIKPVFNWLVADSPQKEELKKYEVLDLQGATSYATLREFCELQGVSRFRYTLVIQVDEYWAKTNNRQFASMSRYLSQPTATIRRKEDDSPTIEVAAGFLSEDPFSLWQPSATDLERMAQAIPRKGGVLKEVNRAGLIATVGYNMAKLVKANEGQQLKVPYCWDFGFMMLDHSVWNTTLTNFQTLDRPDGASTNPHKPRQSWRTFLSLCVKEYPSDDSSMLWYPLAVAPEEQETLACLFLEIWVSQIEASCANASSPRPLREEVEKYFLLRRDDRESSYSLADGMQRFAREAAEALILLSALVPIELIDQNNEIRAFVKETDSEPDDAFENSGNPEQRVTRFPGVRPTRIHGKTLRPMAIRSWYSASKWIDHLNWSADESGTSDSRDPADGTYYIPAQLPGTRSVRGDWFLAVARGSRSYQMGERAIDLLCSRRANIFRLQEGIGLPVRDGSPDHLPARELWTALWRKQEAHVDDRNGGKPKGNLTNTLGGKSIALKKYKKTDRIRYQELLSLGPDSLVSQPPGSAGSGMSWLWRSRINQFDRHARIFRRWLCSMLHQIPDVWKIGDDSILDRMKKLQTALETPGSQDKENLQVISQRIVEFTRSLQRATTLDRIDVPFQD